jgi:hypothetical protein
VAFYFRELESRRATKPLINRFFDLPISQPPDLTAARSVQKFFMNMFEPASAGSIQSLLELENEKTMKKLTFYCLSCRRDTNLERPPVKCEHCGSENGLIFRWRGRSWRAAAGSESSAAPAQ